MYGVFSGSSFELLELNNSGKYLLSNHNNKNKAHTFFKIDSVGEPIVQKYIYQEVGGSSFGSHRWFINSINSYDLIGIHLVNAVPITQVFISGRDSNLLSNGLSKVYSYTSSGTGLASSRDIDSTYTIGGGLSLGPGAYYPILFKLDSVYNIEFSFSYQDYVGFIQKIIQHPDGGYYLLMRLANEGMVLTRTDPNGNILWSKNYGQPYREANGMILQTSGEIFLYGFMNAGSTSGFSTIDIFITKTDSIGNVIWSKKYGDTNNQFYRAGGDPDFYIDTISQTNLVVCGIIKPNTSNSTDIIMMNLDTSGDIQWARRYGNDFFDDMGTIGHKCSDGGFILGGYNNYQFNNFPPVSNLANVTVIKTDSLGVSDGCMEYPITIYSEPDTPLVTNLNWTIYVDSVVTEIPSNMVDTTGTPTRNENMCTFVSLDENYLADVMVTVFPNPSVGIFTVETESMIESMQVIDLTGRVVFEKKYINALELSINIPDIRPGVYCAAVLTKKGMSVVKCVINK